MLFLKFRIAGEWYAAPTADILQVVPPVELRECPGAENAIAGLFVFRGAPVPVVDAAQILGKTAVPRVLSSRILLTALDSPGTTGDAQAPVIGILVEDAVEIIEPAPEDLHEEHLVSANRPGFGKILVCGASMIQIIDLRHLVPAHLSGHPSPPVRG